MSLLIVFIIISIPFYECLIVCLTVFQRWSSCWTRVTESEWRRHRMNWSSWFRRRSWRRPRCSSLPTNRYSLTDGHTHTHLHIGRCAQVWWKKTEWGGQGTAGEGTEGRLSAYLCQQTGTVWQWTHLLTYRQEGTKCDGGRHRMVELVQNREQQEASLLTFARKWVWQQVNILSPTETGRSTTCR